MYRVFCESMNNYINIYPANADEYRAVIAKPLELLLDPDRYMSHMRSGSEQYMKLSDLLVYMEQNIARYPKMKAFLWTLESRGIKGRKFGIAQQDELEEQAKLVNMMLNLMYWDVKINQ